MGTTNVNELELGEVTSPLDPSVGVTFNFPIYAATGAESSAVVYFEVEPGKRLPVHHDSAEEVLYIVQGEGRATVGEEIVPVKAGDLAVIPNWVPHGVENMGTETLKVIGFFGNATMTHMFTEQLFPGDGTLTLVHSSDGAGMYTANSLQPAGVA